MEKLSNNIILYEENIFYLKLTLINIKKSHLININKELFQSKIKDELFFIHKTTQILFEHLINNKKLITKDEQLHSILGLKNLYNQETKILISNNYIKKSDFFDILETNKKDLIQIEQILNKMNNQSNCEDLTTNEELNILFTEEDDEELEDKDKI